MTIKHRASSSFSISQSWTYDVFISFRGKDTRNTFAGHLYNNLAQKGIKTFIDDELKRGEKISSYLSSAIEESKLSVIVFSKNYAFSSWCLEELDIILHCKESSQQIVYPVFYKVDPADVRHQRGSFGLALAKHERRFKDNMEKVVRWKIALTQVANLSGQHLSDEGHEAKFIETIVGEISAKLLTRTHLKVAKYPVGIESRMEDFLTRLHVGENDVRMVGIWGIGGIGKTTIAKAVYNAILHKFEGSCFLENVKETNGGLVQLQNLLLSEILGVKELNITNVHRGVNVIKERLNNKRVLLILDDVNDLEQLNNIAGSIDWFGSGSRIIVTTRDKRLLTAHDIFQIYKVKELSHPEALELFKWSAFNEKKHINDCAEVLMKNVILYAQGVPLVLEVLGSNLRGRHVDQWKVILDSYAKEPMEEVHKKLKISYDALQDSLKEIFLHIACFFNGEKKNYVIDILEGCDLVNPAIGIEVLTEKALVTITEADSIQMHGLLEEMGKEIVRQESPNEPGERSRLWRYQDVYHVFAENTGTSKIKGIMVKDHTPETLVCLRASSFSKLKNLQIFMVTNKCFYGDHVDSLPTELRFLHWEDCPLQSFPSEFNPTKIIMCKMPRGQLSCSARSQTSPLETTTKKPFQLKMPWCCMSFHRKELKNLEAIAARCPDLTKNLDFSRFPNLVDLNLRGCPNIVEVDPSVGCLKNLVNLDLGLCDKLRKFGVSGQMPALKCLDLEWTGIEELDSSSIGYLVKLEKLNLTRCYRLTKVPCSIFELEYLLHVDLRNCLNLVTFPINPEFSTNSRSLHEEVSKNYGSVFVDLNGCLRLVEISEIPRDIRLNLSGCSALERISKLSNILTGQDSKMHPWMDLSSCHLVCENLAQEYVAKMKRRNALSNSNVTALMSLFLSCGKSEFEVIFPESGDLSNNRFAGYDFCCKIERNLRWLSNKGLAIYVQWNKFAAGSFKVYMNGKRHVVNCGEGSFVYPPPRKGHVWLYYVPFLTVMERLKERELPEMFQVKFRFYSGNDDVKICGVHLVRNARRT